AIREVRDGLLSISHWALTLNRSLMSVTRLLNGALLLAALLLPRVALPQSAPHAQAQPRILGDLVDVSEEFITPDNVHFVGSKVTRFDPATGAGLLQWERYVLQPSYSFNKMDVGYVRAPATEFPGTEYDRDPALPFEITFVSPRTVRLRLFTRDL